jgi:hydroxymethylglutaryl-CoA reductase
VEKILAQIKPRFVPVGTLELVSLSGNEIKLKVTGLPQDIFKVQGKIVKADEEIKKEIIKKMQADFKDAKISFI